VDKEDGTRETTVVDYDGRPTRTAQTSGTESLIQGPTTQYEYAQFGVPAVVRAPENHTSSFEYDIVGRQIMLDDPATGQRFARYTGFDEVAGRLDANGDEYCHQFDVLGRLVEVGAAAPAGCDGSESPIVTWTYDERPEPCGTGDTECLTERTLGKLVESTRITRPDSTDSTRTVFHYETDLQGPGRLTRIEQFTPGMVDPFVTSMTYQESRLRDIVYPGTGGTPQVARHDYDVNGTLSAVLDGLGIPYWEILEAEQGVRIKRERFANGVETAYDYYSLANQLSDCGAGGNNACQPGTLRALTTKGSSGNLLSAVNYEYNRTGDLSFRHTTHGVVGSTESVTETFEYDAYQRLAVHDKFEATSAGDEFTLGQYIPSVGGDLNEVRINGEVADQYTYAGSRVTYFNGLSLSHDNNGNLVTRQRADRPDDVYAYNDFDMPWRVDIGGNDSTYLEYDAAQTRVAKRGPSTTTLYAGALYECEGASVVFPDDPIVCETERFNVYVGDRMVAQISGELGETPEVNYIHTDILGSTTLVTDGAESVLDLRQFDPYGLPTAPFAENSPVQGFTGHEHDLDLGLINMKGRLYDPELRRFTTPDPFVTEPLNPQGWNRYAYVMNNPLNRTDPSGFALEMDCTGCAGGSGGGPQGGGSRGGNETQGGPSASPDLDIDRYGMSREDLYAGFNYRAGIGAGLEAIGAAGQPAINPDLSYGYGGPSSGGPPAEHGPSGGQPPGGSAPSSSGESGSTPNPGTTGASDAPDRSGGSSGSGQGRGVPRSGGGGPPLDTHNLFGNPAAVLGGAIIACLGYAPCSTTLLLTLLLALEQAGVLENPAELIYDKYQQEQLEQSISRAGGVDNLTLRQLEQAGIDAERAKVDLVGKEAAGKFNIGVDKVTGEVILTPVIRGSGPNVPTGVTLDDLRRL
jgi:RHS repeat-associated protein